MVANVVLKENRGCGTPELRVAALLWLTSEVVNRSGRGWKWLGRCDGEEAADLYRLAIASPSAKTSCLAKSRLARSRLF